MCISVVFFQYSLLKWWEGGDAMVESPQIWVWPQMPFAGSTPTAHCKWGTFASSQSPPCPSSRRRPGSFCDAPGGGNLGWCGAGTRGCRGWRAGALQAALWARPSGCTQNDRALRARTADCPKSVFGVSKTLWSPGSIQEAALSCRRSGDIIAYKSAWTPLEHCFSIRHSRLGET